MYEMQSYVSCINSRNNYYSHFQCIHSCAPNCSIFHHPLGLVTGFCFNFALSLPIPIRSQQACFTTLSLQIMPMNLASIPTSKVGCGFGKLPKVLIQVTYAKFWELNALALAQPEGHCQPAGFPAGCCSATAAYRMTWPLPLCQPF